jgi:MFS family permease
MSAPSSSGPQHVQNAEKRTWTVGTLTYTSAGIVALFCWLLWGDFSWSLKERAVEPVAKLLLKNFQVSDMLIALLVGSLPQALGMLISPIVGVYSDRHRGRMGRRIPFLLIPTPIAAIGIAGLGFAPALGRMLHESLGASSPGLASCFLAAFFVFWIIFEVANSILLVVFNALVNDVVPKQLIGRFYGLFRIVSLLVGMGFYYFLLERAETWYLPIFVGVAVIYGVGFSLMCLNVREGSYAPPPEMHEGPLRQIARYCRECFATPYYLWIFVAMAMATVSFGPINTFSLFYAKSLGVDWATVGKYTALCYLVSMFLSYPMGALADRFHPIRVGIGVLILYTLLGIWGGLFGTTENGFLIGYVAHTIISGAFFTGTLSIGQRLYPQSRFGQFFSAANVMNATFFTILPPAVGWALDLSGHAYRLTFWIGGGLSALGLLGFLIVLRNYHKAGGDTAYEAP